MRDPATGKFTIAKGKPGSGGSGVVGAEWTGGGLVQATTGKVLFAMGGSYYVCSASVAQDTNTNTSVILTAGHCVFDNAAGAYANWMFVPDYDANPVNLTTSGSFCADTRYGCWTAQALVAHRGFTSQTAFTAQATLYDFAFATGTTNAKTDLFGYPSSAPYTGKVLTYSEGALGYDSRNGNNTYRVTSNMTQGCSGGPWFQGFAAGTGTMMSVNSYSYSGSSYMHGPKLNGNTQALYTTAQGATATVTVG